MGTRDGLTSSTIFNKLLNASESSSTNLSDGWPEEAVQLQGGEHMSRRMRLQGQGVAGGWSAVGNSHYITLPSPTFMDLLYL